VDIAGVIGALAEMDGMAAVLSRAEACARFELPEDRVGDIILISSENKVLGTSAEHHDLSGLDVPLRSHGGLSEQIVPLLCSVPVEDFPPGHRLRNFDAFHLGLNLIRKPASTGETAG
jgi:phosphonoacetate hydrolase